MKDFKQREILITGAGSGIGRAMALAFAKKGAHLWLADRDSAGNQATADEISGQGGTARARTLDVTDTDAFAALASEINGEVGALDILINNAGIGTAGRFLDTTPESWRKTMDINLMGVVNGCHALLPAMVERGRGGHVLNTASAAAFVAGADIPVYAASKFAVRGFTEALRADMARHGIGVTALCPGIINTPILSNGIMEGKMADQQIREKIQSFYQRRGFTADQVADAALKAIRNNVAVQPVSPEAWALYYGKRLIPGLAGRFAAWEMPFVR